MIGSKLTDLAQSLIGGGSESEIDVWTRAIRLFEFEVELLYPGPTFGIPNEGNGRMRRAAGLFVVMRLLEVAEARVGERLGGTPDLASLAQDSLFGYFYTELMRRGGLRRIRHMLSARAFHRRIEQRWKGASQVAELIDISFRFNRAEVSTRHKGGITSAIQYAAEAPEFDGRYNESALKANWRTYRASSIFLYLICGAKLNCCSKRIVVRRSRICLLHTVMSIALLLRKVTAFRSSDL